MQNMITFATKLLVSFLAISSLGLLPDDDKVESELAAIELVDAVQIYEQFEGAGKQERQNLGTALVRTLVLNRQLSDAQKVASTIGGPIGRELKIQIARIKLSDASRNRSDLSKSDVESFEKIARENGHLVRHLIGGIDGLLANEQHEKVQALFDSIEGDLTNYEYRPRVYDNLNAKLEVLASIVGNHAKNSRDGMVEKLVGSIDNPVTRCRLVELVMDASIQAEDIETAEKVLKYVVEPRNQRKLGLKLGLHFAIGNDSKAEEYARNLDTSEEDPLFASLCLHLAFSNLEREKACQIWVEKAENSGGNNLDMRADILALKALSSDLEIADDWRLVARTVSRLIGSHPVRRSSVLVRFSRKQSTSVARELVKATGHPYVQSIVLTKLIEKRVFEGAEAKELVDSVLHKFSEQPDPVELFDGQFLGRDEALHQIARAYALTGEFEKSLDVIEQVSEEATTGPDFSDLEPAKETTQRRMGLQVASFAISERTENYSTKKSDEIVNVVNRLCELEGDERNDYLNQLLVGLVEAKNWSDALSVARIALEDWNGRISLSEKIFDGIARSDNVQILKDWFQVLGEERGRSYLSAICIALRNRNLIPSSPFVIEISALFKRHDLGAMPPHVLKCMAVGLWADGHDQEAKQYIDQLKDADVGEKNLQDLAMQCLKSDLPQLAFYIIEISKTSPTERLCNSVHPVSSRYSNLVKDDQWYSRQSPQVQIVMKINYARQLILDRTSEDNDD